MTVIVGLHASMTRHREGIARHGLLCHSPRTGRPFGVYIFRDDGEFDHPTFNSRSRWSATDKGDVWEVAYMGPLLDDQYVSNGIILLYPAMNVTLVTGHK